MRTLYFVAFMAIFTCASGVAVAAEKPATPAKGGNAPAAPAPATFTGTPDLAGRVQIASGLSDDKQAMTVLFRNLQASVSGPGGALVATRSVTVTLPIDNKNQETQVTQDIRGFVELQGKARAVLVVQAAGKTTVVDLKKAQVKDKSAPPSPGPAPQQAKDRAKAQLKGPPQTAKTERAFDFAQRLQGTVAAGASYQVTFFLLVERDAATVDAGALLAIDSLDVGLGKAAVTRKKY